MILMNRKTIIDCAGCGGRYEVTAKKGEAFATPCPACGHSPEWQGEAAEP